MTYEYKCRTCNHEWQKDQKITAKPLKRCPKCKKNKAYRLISGGAGFQLLGSGWASDLYSSKK